ncbi:MAG: hypothetical protein ACXAES_04595, partial [Promethearchaeota archaeon]
MLPVSSKSSRSRISGIDLESDPNKQQKSSRPIELTDIPQEALSNEESLEKGERLTEKVIPHVESPINTSEIDSEISEDSNRQVLQEITPTPFQGSILNSQEENITQAFTELKNAVTEPKKGKSRSKPTL